MTEFNKSTLSTPMDIKKIFQNLHLEPKHPLPLKNQDLSSVLKYSQDLNEESDILNLLNAISKPDDIVFNDSPYVMPEKPGLSENELAKLKNQHYVQDDEKKFEGLKLISIHEKGLEKDLKESKWRTEVSEERNPEIDFIKQLDQEDFIRRPQSARKTRHIRQPSYGGVKMNGYNFTHGSAPECKVEEKKGGRKSSKDIVYDNNEFVKGWDQVRPNSGFTYERSDGLGGTRSSRFFEQGRIMLDGGEERFYTENLDNDGGSPIKILVSKGASVKIQGSQRLKPKNLQGGGLSKSINGKKGINISRKEKSIVEKEHRNPFRTEHSLESTAMGNTHNNLLSDNTLLSKRSKSPRRKHYHQQQQQPVLDQTFQSRTPFETIESPKNSPIDTRPEVLPHFGGENKNKASALYPKSSNKSHDFKLPNQPLFNQSRRAKIGSGTFVKPGTPDSAGRSKSLSKTRVTEDYLRGLRKSQEKMSVYTKNIDLTAGVRMDTEARQNRMINKIKQGDRESFKIANKIFYKRQTDEVQTQRDAIENPGLMKVLSHSKPSPSSSHKRSLTHTYRGTGGGVAQNKVPECLLPSGEIASLYRNTPTRLELPKLHLSMSTESLVEPGIVNFVQKQGGSLTERGAGNSSIKAKVNPIHGLSVTPKDLNNVGGAQSERNNYHRKYKNEKVYSSSPFQNFGGGSKLHYPISPMKTKVSLEFLRAPKEALICPINESKERLSTSGERKRSARGARHIHKPVNQAQTKGVSRSREIKDAGEMSGINFVGKKPEPLNMKELTKALPLDVANYYLKKLDQIMGSNKNEKRSQKFVHTMTMSKDTERSDAVGQEKGSSFQRKEKSFSSRNKGEKVSLDEQNSRIILYSEANVKISGTFASKKDKREVKNAKN